MAHICMTSRSTTHFRIVRYEASHCLSGKTLVSMFGRLALETSYGTVIVSFTRVRCRDKNFEIQFVARECPKLRPAVEDISVLSFGFFNVPIASARALALKIESTQGLGPFICNRLHRPYDSVNMIKYPAFTERRR